MANKHKQDANYYAFQLGYLIKAVLKHVPNIIKESILATTEGGKDKHLLSFQKIYNIATNEKFGEFVVAMTDVVKTYGAQIQNLSDKDADGVLQIFKELQNEKEAIKGFLEKVKTNSDELKKDTNANTYCAAKIMMYVLIGKTSIESIKANVEQLTQLLNTLKDQISKILASDGGSAMNVDGLTQKLNEIKERSDSIKDPCPSASQP